MKSAITGIPIVNGPKNKIFGDLEKFKKYKRDQTCNCFSTQPRHALETFGGPGDGVTVWEASETVKNWSLEPILRISLNFNAFSMEIDDSRVWSFQLQILTVSGAVHTPTSAPAPPNPSRACLGCVNKK